MSIPRKRCKICGLPRPLDEFHKHKGSADGLGYQCKACQKVRYRQWYEQNRSYFHDYASKNRDRQREAARRYEAANRDKRRIRYRLWYVRNPERAREAVRKWAKRNPERRAATYNNYRARKLGNGGAYTVAQWRSLCAQYDYRCLCCGKRKRLTADHIVPVTKGGTSNISNIQPLCQSCNSSKGDRTIDFRTRTPGEEYQQEQLL